MTLTPVAERLAVELSIPVFTTGDRTPISRMRGDSSTSTSPRRLDCEKSVRTVYRCVSSTEYLFRNREYKSKA